jgi:hypothetical protein
MAAGWDCDRYGHHCVRLQIWYLLSRFVSRVVDGAPAVPPLASLPLVPAQPPLLPGSYNPTAANPSRVIVVEERELFVL